MRTQEDLKLLQADQPHCPVWVLSQLWGFPSARDQPHTTSWLQMNQDIYAKVPILLPVPVWVCATHVSSPTWLS